MEVHYTALKVIVSEKNKSALVLTQRCGKLNKGALALYVSICLNVLALSAEVEISPIYTEIVAVSVKGLLLGITDAHTLNATARSGLLYSNGALSSLIKAKLFSCVDSQLNIVALAVYRLISNRHIRNGTGHNMEIIHKKRSSEASGKLDLTVSENSGGRHSVDIERDLPHFVKVSVISEEGKYSSVYANGSDYRVGLTCPVHCFLIVKIFVG
jgi:hypothetical protein